MCVCVCVRVCMCIYKCRYTYTHTHTYIYIYIQKSHMHTLKKDAGSCYVLSKDSVSCAVALASSSGCKFWRGLRASTNKLLSSSKQLVSLNPQASDPTFLNARLAHVSSSAMLAFRHPLRPWQSVRFPQRADDFKGHLVTAVTCILRVIDHYFVYHATKEIAGQYPRDPQMVSMPCLNGNPQSPKA